MKPIRLPTVRVVAERDQGAEVAVDEGLQRRPLSRRRIWPQHVARLLVRGLGARRQRAVVAVGQRGRRSRRWRRCRGRGWSAGWASTTSWLERLASSPSRSASTSGPLTPAAQTTSSDGTKPPSASWTPSAVTSVTRAPVRTSTPSSRSRRGGGGGEALGQGRQDARGGLDQGDRDVLVGVDPVEAVGDDARGRCGAARPRARCRWRRRR